MVGYEERFSLLTIRLAACARFGYAVIRICISTINGYNCSNTLLKHLPVYSNKLWNTYDRVYHVSYHD